MREADLLALHERFPARYPVLLESVSGAEPLGRHDVLFALPGERLIAVRLTAAWPATFPKRLQAAGSWTRSTAGSRANAARVDVASSGAVFADGWFLYLGYELAAEIEPTLRLPASRAAARGRLAHARRAAARPPHAASSGSSRAMPDGSSSCASRFAPTSPPSSTPPAGCRRPR